MVQCQVMSEESKSHEPWWGGLLFKSYLWSSSVITWHYKIGSRKQMKDKQNFQIRVKFWFCLEEKSSTSISISLVTSVWIEMWMIKLCPQFFWYLTYIDMQWTVSWSPMKKKKQTNKLLWLHVLFVCPISVSIKLLAHTFIRSISF